MCARHTQIRDLRAIIALVMCQGGVPAWTPRYNIAPQQSAPVIVADEATSRLKTMRWGLVPFWATDEQIGSKLINTRAESVADKPSFRQAFAQRRCLIPADGYYEWETTPQGKMPRWFSLRDDVPFAFAGLWERWTPKSQPTTQPDLFAANLAPAPGPLETFTIITTQANELVQPVHDRMPVILTGPELARWMAPAAASMALTELLRPYPAEAMFYRAASPCINNPRHEGPQCWEKG